MIRYALKCEDGHGFESWFQSAEAFETLRAAGHLSCVECGSSDVRKAVMAPRVAKPRAAATTPGPQTDQADAATPAAPAPPAGAAAAEPAPRAVPAEVEKALRALREKVEATSEYVGPRFARKARAMHLGEEPERPIYGEAKPEEARALLEDGVPLVPLPFRPKRKLS